MKKNSNPTIEIEQIRDKDQALLEIKFRDDKKKISLMLQKTNEGPHEEWTLN